MVGHDGPPSKTREECCWDIIRSMSLYYNAVSINEFLEQAAKKTQTESRLRRHNQSLDTKLSHTMRREIGTGRVKVIHM